VAAVDGVTPVRIHMLNTGVVSLVHRSANGEIEGVGTLLTARKLFDGKVFPGPMPADP
jgi:2-methylaconitate cis-trans-isomerase PrpF